MKKLNEDINITDPNLAQQYNRGQALLVQKDQVIVKLQDQINKVEKEKMKIEKELNKISQESAKQQGQTQPVNTQGQQQNPQNQQTVQVTGTPVNQAANEGILIKIDGDKIDIEIDQLTDRLSYLQNNNGDPGEIESLENQINGLINQDEETPSYIKNMIGDQRFVDDIEDETRYSDDIEEKEPEMINDEFDSDDEIEDYYDQQYRKELEDEDYRWRSQKEEDDYEDLDEGYDDETPRFSGMIGRTEDNYEMSPLGKPIRRLSTKEKYPWKSSSNNRKKKAWSDSRLEKYESLEKEISELEDNITYLKQDIEDTQERYSSPSYEGVEEEMEEFWASLSHDQREVLNSGAYKNDKDRIADLKKYGAENPERILKDYYYYYPEYDKTLDKERKQNEKIIKKLSEELEKLEKKLQKKQEQLDSMGYPRYIDENFSNPMSIENFYNLSEAYVEDDTSISRDKEEYLDNDYLFYIKVIKDDGEWFIGKIFKINPDGEWYGMVKAGNDGSFEKMSYESEWDEIDITNFLEEQYDNVEIIDKHEFDDYMEDKDEDIEEGWPSNTL